MPQGNQLSWTHQLYPVRLIIIIHTHTYIYSFCSMIIMLIIQVSNLPSRCPFGEWDSLFSPRQLESLPVHSPHHAIFCPLQALWHMSPVFSGMHSCFYLQALERKTCMMETVQVSTETGPFELHVMSLLQSGFSMFGVLNLATNDFDKLPGSTKGWNRWSLVIKTI